MATREEPDDAEKSADPHRSRATPGRNRTRGSRVRSTPAEELRAIARAARGLLEELAEEGVDHFEEIAAVPLTGSGGHSDAAPGPAGAEARARAPAPPPAQLDMVEAPSEWGDRPSLDAIREALGDCTRCRLCEGRSQIVFGDGNPQADLMFVGEGPGVEEDRRGLPFVGRAGELLTAMIEKGLGMARSEVYICNIVKCRPPENRTPLADEASTCRPFLDGQIAAVRPRVIVTLGKPAASLLLGRDVPITRIRGTWQEYRGIPLMPTLHPAFVLRRYTEENRRNVWGDLKAALTRARGEPQ
jgi:DNA polymerase